MYFHLKIAFFFILLCPACKKGNSPALEEAAFGGGCFWVLDYYFEQVEGVSESKCIYTSEGSEAVLLKYDPEKVKFSNLCKIFFELHDTEKDYKPQYKSLVQVSTEKQKRTISQLIKKLKLKKDVKTEIKKMTSFTLPDAMHEDWHKKKNTLPKCKIPERSIIKSLIQH